MIIKLTPPEIYKGI